MLDYPIHGAKHRRFQGCTDDDVAEVQLGLGHLIGHADIVLRTVEDVVASLFSGNGPKEGVLPKGKSAAQQQHGQNDEMSFHSDMSLNLLTKVSCLSRGREAIPNFLMGKSKEFCASFIYFLIKPHKNDNFNPY